MENKLLAGVSTPPDAGSISNPVFKGTILETYTWPDTPTAFFNFLIQRAITVGFVIGTLYFLFQFITGAIAWIGSGGDKQSLETAKAKLTQALTGLVILFATFAIIKFLEEFFGVGILTLDILPLAI